MREELKKINLKGNTINVGVNEWNDVSFEKDSSVSFNAYCTVNLYTFGKMCVLLIKNNTQFNKDNNVMVQITANIEPLYPDMECYVNGSSSGREITPNNLVLEYIGNGTFRVIPKSEFYSIATGYIYFMFPIK